MRWTDRLIGLASTLVLARLLAPQDFGLVAMAMLVVGLIDVLLDLGVNAALIQNRSADDEDFNTAWTLRLSQATFAAAVLALGAPLAADYFNDTRVTDILRVIALSLWISGFENIGVVRFQKDMEFGRDFQFFFLKRVFSTVLTLVLAFALRSYWALVLGTLASRAFGVALSYLLHEFRPRFSLQRLRGLWAFSQWNVVQSVTGYLTNRTDQFVVGRRADAATMGAYSVADELASLPTTEILAPLGRVMFPAFVNARHDDREFGRIVLLAFAVQAFIGIPAGVGVALVAHEMVPLVLGNQWLPSIPLVQILGLVGMVTALVHSGHYALLSLGRIRDLSLFMLARFVLLLTVLAVLFPGADARDIAGLRLGVAFAALIGMTFLMIRFVPGVSLRDMSAKVWRPVVAAAIMVLAVLAVELFVNQAAIWVALSSKVVVGAFAYMFAVVALWCAVGRPVGAEAYLLGQIRRRTNGSPPGQG
jgi:O-antigen/teichoic acid export membrane protein